MKSKNKNIILGFGCWIFEFGFSWCKGKVINYLLMMSSSCIFPAQVELWSFRAEPSRVEPSQGTLIFELKQSWIFWCIVFFLTPKISHFIKKQYYLQQSKPKIEWKCRWNKKKSGRQKMAIFWFSSWKKKFELKEKGHDPSRDELKILQLELWLKPVWLRLITSN